MKSHVRDMGEYRGFFWNPRTKKGEYVGSHLLDITTGQFKRRYGWLPEEGESFMGTPERKTNEELKKTIKRMQEIEDENRFTRYYESFFAEKLLAEITKSQLVVLKTLKSLLERKKA